MDLSYSASALVQPALKVQGTDLEKPGVVIVGGGLAGVAAARAFRRARANVVGIDSDAHLHE